MSEAKKDMYKTPETADGGLLSDILVKVGKRNRADEEGAAGDGQETESENVVFKEDGRKRSVKRKEFSNYGLLVNRPF
jgi:hypothetical protein